MKNDDIVLLGAVLLGGYIAYTAIVKPSPAPVEKPVSLCETLKIANPDSVWIYPC